jgi:ADP-ribosylation factor-binding protein GGA
MMPLKDPERKPDYEQQTQKELNGIQQRVLLLNEMLNNANPDERFVEGDAFDVCSVSLACQILDS